MCYLHGSSLRSHGSLKSSNCLIDSRWVLKISNYGMDAFREEREVGEHERYRDLQWTAPELLRLADSARPKYGTQKGDVYSFAIIMHEIVYRSMPFGGNLSPKGGGAWLIFKYDPSIKEIEQQRLHQLSVNVLVVSGESWAVWSLWQCWTEKGMHWNICPLIIFSTDSQSSVIILQRLPIERVKIWI